jgi:Spy/CpxP family protein refolding chaperone
MKTTILLAAAITVSGGIWLRAQQSEPENLGKASAAEAAQSTRCEAMCAMKHSSQNPANILNWDQALNLTDEQRARLRAIEDKASNEAKELLTVEQQEKLKELAKPESMMRCMRAMKHPEATDEQIGHDASLGCSEMDDKAEGAHPSH